MKQLRINKKGIKGVVTKLKIFVASPFLLAKSDKRLAIFEKYIRHYVGYDSLIT